ncbi:MAG: DUF1801 domain-containing protein [Chitinophagaceae bacterium]
MQSDASSVAQYMAELPADHQEAMEKLRKAVRKNIPKGFLETMNYGMIGYVVPHKLYPGGYHCDPAQPLPFMNLASQKNHIAVYHMGVYAMPKLNKWFVDAYAKTGMGKLDMGKSCIRFKNPAKIPFDLIGELASKLTVDEWIAYYEKEVARK